MECWFRRTFLFVPLFIDFMLSRSTDNAVTIRGSKQFIVTQYTDSVMS